MKENRNDLLRLCTLSGTTEIGRNCNFVELGDEIIIIDAGYSFPGQEMYGIDYLIPNSAYLKKNKHKVKAILITHGHLDHTGALKWILPDLDYPPVYAGGFAKALIEAKMREYKMEKKVKIISVDRQSTVNIGNNFRASFIGINHSIPDAFSIFLESRKGNIFFSGDYKIDMSPANEPQTDYDTLRKLRGHIDLALMESTNASNPGKAPSETEIFNNLTELISKQKGRVIVAAFSSLITRLYSLIEVAKKTNRKIVLSGKSLELSIDIARKKGYIKFEDKLLVRERNIGKYPDRELLLLCTGSQAERFAALNRISLNEHKNIKIKKGDVIIMSSSEIPENISSIERMTDRLIALGADLVKDSQELKIHSTGHGNQDDMKMMFDLIQPKSIMPVHGPLTFRYFNKQNFIKWGVNENNIFLTDDGQVWEFNGYSWTKGKKIESKPILIDGLGVGDIGDIVLKDRKQLSEYGMFTVVLNMSSKNKQIIGRPKFISRGFVYMKGSKKLLQEIENLVYDIHREWSRESSKTKMFKEEQLRERIEKELSKLIYKKTEREPIILTAII
ncbi:MAG: ribonuclease J [Candidatus Dojkabacteria bacterium]|nr:ribonuclease J [Candidatus Dojkabacteria bacterium]